MLSQNDKNAKQPSAIKGILYKKKRMHTKVYVIVLFCIAGLISSCEKDELEYKNDFRDSKTAWLRFKASSNNSYTYEVQQSSWAGFSSVTTITVSNGEIKERRFKYSFLEEGVKENIKEEDREWIENENEIGTHNSTGAQALLLGEIYTKAEQDWLLKRKNAKIYFKTENKGLISTCGYVEDDCQDDCFIGITIKSIEAL